MARKPRDYKAEERRRNELAQKRGFTTRAAQRGAIERGKFRALAPERIRSPKVKAAQQSLLSGSAVPRGFVPPNAYDLAVAARTRSQECEDWSERNAATTVAKYRPDDHQRVYVGGKFRGQRINMKHSPWMRATNVTDKRKQKWIDQHGMEAYTDVYYGAFVNDDSRYTKARYSGGSDALFIWLVEVTGYLTAEEYESRYGAHVQR